MAQEKMDVGIKKNGVYLGTRHLPNRKQASLVIEQGNVTAVIGIVKDEELWERYLTMMLSKEGGN